MGSGRQIISLISSNREAKFHQTAALLHLKNAKTLHCGGFLVKMVGRVGFEPTTNWLKANCSTD